MHIKELGYPEKGVETRLNCIRAPFGYSRGIFTELFGKPFVGSLLLHKHDFDSVYIFAHDVFVLFNDAKLTNFSEKSVMLCHKIERTFQEIAFRAMKYYLE